LFGEIYVSQGGRVAFVTHHLLKHFGFHPFGIDRRKRMSKIMKTVGVVKRRVLVIFKAGQMNSHERLDTMQLKPEFLPIMRPGEDKRVIPITCHFGKVFPFCATSHSSRRAIGIVGTRFCLICSGVTGCVGLNAWVLLPPAFRRQRQKADDGAAATPFVSNLLEVT